MKKEKQAIINKIITSLDWKKIKLYHNKLGIKWQYEDDKELVFRTPTIPELKNDLQKILEHMVDEKLDYISHGSWIVFWDLEIDNIRVIFRLADFCFDKSKKKETNTLENLEILLKKAIDTEDYESAAKLRDQINREKCQHQVDI